jgi:chemotaxis-related protein WspB
VLLLLFSADQTYFAIRAKEVIEVLPLLELKPLLGVPEYVIGLCNYRDQFVPIIDLNLLLNEKPCQQYMTSRILLVHYPLTHNKTMLLGILVEGLTESIKKEAEDFSSSGIFPVNTPFLGSTIYKDKDNIVYLIRVSDLLTPDVRELVLKSANQAVNNG